jgi:hypothetical protein
MFLFYNYFNFWYRIGSRLGHGRSQVQGIVIIFINYLFSLFCARLFAHIFLIIF